jgi:uncharacterized protein
MNPMFLIMILAVMTSSACAKPSTLVADEDQVATTITGAPIHFYRTYLSGADGQRCPMTPSCSRYALTAIERHGALMGWIMACDRLMRCGRDELKHSPSVMTRSGVHCQDAVENNDFWWH